jgi:hypothetical protein
MYRPRRHPPPRRPSPSQTPPRRPRGPPLVRTCLLWTGRLQTRPLLTRPRRTRRLRTPPAPLRWRSGPMSTNADRSDYARTTIRHLTGDKGGGRAGPQGRRRRRLTTPPPARSQLVLGGEVTVIGNRPRLPSLRREPPVPGSRGPPRPRAASTDLRAGCCAARPRGFVDAPNRPLRTSCRRSRPNRAVDTFGYRVVRLVQSAHIADPSRRTEPMAWPL